MANSAKPDHVGRPVSGDDALRPEPCPFCGGGELLIEEVDQFLWAVVCPTCDAIGPSAQPAQSMQKAIKHWNRRRASN
jgi:Lar family restriction alleviation protein